MNYGRRFPVAFTWVQATDGGRIQMLLTGGKLLWRQFFVDGSWPGRLPDSESLRCLLVTYALVKPARFCYL